MKLSLDTAKTTIYITSKSEVTAVQGFVDGKRSEEQSRDKTTGLPLWSIVAEIIQGDEIQTGVKIKIAAETAPTVTPRTEYKIDGDLFATPYLQTGGRNAEVSFLLVGSLKANRLPALGNKD